MISEMTPPDYFVFLLLRISANGLIFIDIDDETKSAHDEKLMKEWNKHILSRSVELDLF